MSYMECFVMFDTRQLIGGIAMKTKEIKKGKPAAKKTVKTREPLNGRTSPKVDENVCTQAEVVVREGLCCCEEECC
jgi:hypothetical protein